MEPWVTSTLNKLFTKGFIILKLNFQKNKVVSGKTPHFVKDPSCTLHSICLNPNLVINEENLIFN